MHCELGISNLITLAPIWRMDDIKATLRCHAHVNRSVHRGTAATSTTLGLILPVIGWALNRRIVFSHSGPVPRYTVFEAQILMDDHKVCAPTQRFELGIPLGIDEYLRRLLNKLKYNYIDDINFILETSHYACPTLWISCSCRQINTVKRVILLLWGLLCVKILKWFSGTWWALY